MTGSALFDFFIAMVVLFGAGALFFYAIDGIAKDPLFAKIAKLAVGIALFVAFLFAVKGVLFGGAGATVVSPLGIIAFAIGIIVVLIVIYLVQMAVDMFIPQFAGPIMYVLGGICIIALLVLAEQTLFGGNLVGYSRGTLLH